MAKKNTDKDVVVQQVIPEVKDQVIDQVQGEQVVENTQEIAEQVPESITSEVLEQVAVQEELVVSTNPNFVKWPLDTYGITTNLRKDILQLGSRVMGHPGKRAIVEQTLAVATAYLAAKYAKESAR